MMSKYKSIFDQPGRKLQFLNSFYSKPQYSNGKQIIPDCLGIIYRDEETGEKDVEFLLEPQINFYMAYDDVEINYPLRHISKDLVEKCSCRFNDLALTLAKTAGDEMVRDYYETLKKAPYKAKKKYHQLPYIFNSDMDIEDFWKGEFLDTFTSEKDNLTKAYYDIEVDGVDYPSFPDEHIAPCPINAITYVNSEFMTCHTYLLRNYDNPLIEQEENNLEGLKQHMRETLRDDFKYFIYFFDSELDLIESFFKQVNKDKPDFCLA